MGRHVTIPSYRGGRCCNSWKIRCACWTAMLVCRRHSAIRKFGNSESQIPLPKQNILVEWDESLNVIELWVMNQWWNPAITGIIVLVSGKFKGFTVLWIIHSAVGHAVLVFAGHCQSETTSIIDNHYTTNTREVNCALFELEIFAEWSSHFIPFQWFFCNTTSS